MPAQIVAQIDLPRGIDVGDDGRTSDRNTVIHFHDGGFLEFDVGGGTAAHGAWRASPDGVFVAEAAGGDGPWVGETHRPRPWLSSAASVTVEGQQMVLRDDTGAVTARFERAADPTGSAAGATPPDGRAPRPLGLPTGLVPVEHDEMLGAWAPTHLAVSPSPARPEGMRWQNVEFTGDGQWRAFPVVNIGGGRWRSGPGGTVLVLHPYGQTMRGHSYWVDLNPWLFPTARAGFDDNPDSNPDASPDGGELVLLDDNNRELQRLHRLPDW